MADVKNLFSIWKESDALMKDIEQYDAFVRHRNLSKIESKDMNNTFKQLEKIEKIRQRLKAKLIDKKLT